MVAREYLETLAFLEKTPQRVAELAAGLKGDALRRRPASGSFSAIEQVCHLRDIEQEGYLVRIQRMLAEDDPVFEDIAGDKLAIARDYQSQSVADALAAFGRARKESIRKLQAASTAQLARTGHFAGTEEFTLTALAGMMRAHDAGHLQELSDLRQL